MRYIKRSETGKASIYVVAAVMLAAGGTVLYPAFMSHACGGQQSACQSNLSRIGKAIKSYMGDCNGKLPANRSDTHHKALSDGSSIRPSRVFLSGQTIIGVKCRVKLHSDGSNIMFTDGHVKHFKASDTPTDREGLGYDSDTKQWWNFKPNNPRRSIAITP